MKWRTHEENEMEIVTTAACVTSVTKYAAMKREGANANAPEAWQQQGRNGKIWQLTAKAGVCWPCDGSENRRRGIVETKEDNVSRRRRDGKR